MGRLASFDPRRSLRARLALAVAVLGVALSTGIGVAVYSVTAHDLVGAARRAQTRSVIAAAGVYDRTGKSVAGTVQDLVLVPRPLQQAVFRGLLGTYVTGAEIWAGAPEEGGSQVYVESPNPATHTLATLRTTILIVGGIAVLLAAGLGALLATGLSRRLRTAADVADRVAGGELEARITARGADEVARLGNAIDEMAAALSARIARERRFSADVAHELRTPLTALVSAGALLGDERPAQIVRERVSALRTLVEDLLEMSRLEQGGESLRLETVDLAALAASVIEAQGSGAELVVESGPPAPIETDPRRVERILANLLDNAERHGAAPVTVTVTDRSIKVTDSGPGYPAEILRDGPVPFRTGARERGTGTGLGLTIAGGQAAALGAELKLENHSSGATVSLLFGPAD